MTNKLTHRLSDPYRVHTSDSEYALHGVYVSSPTLSRVGSGHSSVQKNAKSFQRLLEKRMHEMASYTDLCIKGERMRAGEVKYANEQVAEKPIEAQRIQEITELQCNSVQRNSVAATELPEGARQASGQGIDILFDKDKKSEHATTRSEVLSNILRCLGQHLAECQPSSNTLKWNVSKNADRHSAGTFELISQDYNLTFTLKDQGANVWSINVDGEDSVFFVRHAEQLTRLVKGQCGVNIELTSTRPV